MIGVGDKFPSFNLKSVVPGTDQFVNIDNNNFIGTWSVVFSWPKDFTFVCPTEIAEFSNQAPAFAEKNAKVYGFSTDNEFVHLAWRSSNKLLNNLRIPMLSDIKHELSNALGVLDEKEGVAQRATFIVDPAGIVRFVMVTDLNVGRNVNEVLRVLDALQTDELTPCGWTPGKPTLG
jgi:lipoyl-dependent peroxiredoxin subunit C